MSDLLQAIAGALVALLLFILLGLAIGTVLARGIGWLLNLFTH